MFVDHSIERLAPAAEADTVTGVVGVVVAGTVFFTGISPTVARCLVFRVGVCASDALSPTHCSVGVAVVGIIVAVVVGTVISLYVQRVALQAVQRLDSLHCRRQHCLPCQMIRGNLMCTESRI